MLPAVSTEIIFKYLKHFLQMFSSHFFKSIKVFLKLFLNMLGLHIKRFFKMKYVCQIYVFCHQAYEFIGCFMMLPILTSTLLTLVQCMKIGRTD